MAIIQISKMQQRSGNLVDLPQLDEGEIGFASDVRQIFVGKTSPNENIEVLTSYSNISFSQITGTNGGNLNISNAENGQVLTYIASTDTWENYPSTDILTANANFKLNLGNASSLNISGGAIGYILETDGTGNLNWTPKGSIQVPIVALSAATPIVMTVANTTPLVNGLSVTIVSVAGTNANTIVNGQSFYVTLAVDYATSGNVSLYTDAGRTVGAVGTGLVATPNTGVALATISGGGSGGTGVASGPNTAVQFNENGFSNGVSAFTFNKDTNSLVVSGPVTANSFATASSVTANVFISNIATGTSPLTVTSTTRVANLNVDRANVSEYEAVTAASTGTFYPIFASGSSTGNYAMAANSNISVNIATGTLSAPLIAGTLTTTNQPNITSIGTLTSLNVNGTITAVAFTANAGVFSGNANGLFNIIGANITGAIGLATYATTANAVAGGNVSGQVANTLVAGTVYTAAQPNITSVGTLTSLTASGDITTTGNISGNYLLGNGSQITGLPAGYSNVDVASFLPTYTGNMVSMAGNITTSANISGSYILGNGSLLSGIVTGAPAAGALTGNTINSSVIYSNLNSVGTLANLSVTGNITTTAITTGANTTAGTITGNWSLTTGSKLNATYADLAEYYSSDMHYEPGTVVEFGGDCEVTLGTDGTARVAGVISTDPAFAMNAKCAGKFTVAIALQGRVPCKVRGKIHKGDMLISAGNGYARPSNNPIMGSVIGKSLENFEGIEGVIEVAVGRL